MSGRLSNAWAGLRREAGLLRRERSVWAWWGVLLLLALLALASGLQEVADQRATIARLQAADRADRAAVLAQQQDWGSAAYASFHLTVDPPSDLAFAALGRRDDSAWKHRIRLLALEGQIHERDAGHPVLALVGRVDLAFVAAFVLPLVLIVLLHDLRASERAAGRDALLVATAGDSQAWWRWRLLLRAAGATAAVALPLLAGGLIAGTGPALLAAAVGAVLAHAAVWSLLAGALATWRRPGEVILAALLGLWLLLAVLLPAVLRAGIDRAVPLPAGADIVLTQREAVNDAWDLPRSTTMDAFVARHPEWSAHTRIDRPFAWTWYFAFQQVGDQQAEALSQAYTEGRRTRDRWAARAAWLMPPVLLQRRLQSLAGTDTEAVLAYEARVRAFHAALRHFHYPRLFHGEAFDPAALSELPRFSPAATP